MPTKHIDFGFRVARIARRLRQAVDAELRAYGLTDATWRPLAYVGKLGGGVRQKELATALSIEPWNSPPAGSTATPGRTSKP